MKKSLLIVAILALLYPVSSSALTMDELISAQVQGQVAGVQNINANATVVLNQITGEVLVSNNADKAWVPASLTKLVTALVVLDTKPNFNKTCNVINDDNVGGAKLAAVNGGKYKLKDLFSATLVASANNAANALARCTDMSRADFVAKMNEKAKQFEALHTSFVDPSGIDEHSVTTASDFAKIANAAFSTATIRDYASQPSVYFCSLNSPKKCHNLKNTNKLFGDTELQVIAGKTGYLNESLYNFAASSKNQQGQYLITVVLGSDTQKQSFESTKVIAQLGFKKLASKLAAATVK